VISIKGRYNNANNSLWR